MIKNLTYEENKFLVQKYPYLFAALTSAEDNKFPYETLEQCKQHYCPPVKKYITCEEFGYMDGMNGSCQWCQEMTPIQWHMCSDKGKFQADKNDFDNIINIENLKANNDLVKINKVSNQMYKSDEIKISTIIVATDKIDRDFERFTVEALHQMAELIIGKNFVDTTRNRQVVGKIFDAWVETNNEGDKEVNTLKAKVYIPINDDTQDIIKELTINKNSPVSIACSVREANCSICGKNTRTHSCQHKKAQVYNGEICVIDLSNVTDFYELRINYYIKE